MKESEPRLHPDLELVERLEPARELAKMTPELGRLDVGEEPERLEPGGDLVAERSPGLVLDRGLPELSAGVLEPSRERR